jgi:hypothetical protein
MTGIFFYTKYTHASSDIRLQGYSTSRIEIYDKIEGEGVAKNFFRKQESIEELF